MRTEISKLAFLFSAVAWSTALLSQQAIPAGTIIPIQLNSTLNSANAKPGREFTARVMQDVPGTKIHAGNRVFGHVVSAVPNKDGNEAQLTLRFDAVRISKQPIPISADVGAIGSMMGSRRRAGSVEWP